MAFRAVQFLLALRAVLLLRPFCLLFMLRCFLLLALILIFLAAFVSHCRSFRWLIADVKSRIHSTSVGQAKIAMVVASAITAASSWPFTSPLATSSRIESSIISSTRDTSQQPTDFESHASRVHQVVI